jgi:hypothetical protein
VTSTISAAQLTKNWSSRAAFSLKLVSSNKLVQKLQVLTLGFFSYFGASIESNSTMFFLIIVLFVMIIILFAVVAAIASLSNGVQETKVPLPYRQKQYFFSKSELEFYKILNSHLDAHRYTVFTKVRLADFVEVLSASRGEYKWLNKIIKKHVDFLIWDLVESKIVLAIELDGKSHNGATMTKSDSFKDDLYETVGLRLERVKVGSSFEEESARLVGIL